PDQIAVTGVPDGKAGEVGRAIGADPGGDRVRAVAFGHGDAVEAPVRSTIHVGVRPEIERPGSVESDVRAYDVQCAAGALHERPGSVDRQSCRVDAVEPVALGIGDVQLARWRVGRQNGTFEGQTLDLTLEDELA